MTEENRTLDDKFALRLPKTLKEKIAEQAKLNNRSTNAEMVARLERTIAEDVERESGGTWIAKAKNAATASNHNKLFEIERRVAAIEALLKKQRLL